MRTARPTPPACGWFFRWLLHRPHRRLRCPRCDALLLQVLGRREPDASERLVMARRRSR